MTEYDFIALCQSVYNVPTTFEINESGNVDIRPENNNCTINLLKLRQSFEDDSLILTNDGNIMVIYDNQTAVLHFK